MATNYHHCDVLAHCSFVDHETSTRVEKVQFLYTFFSVFVDRLFAVLLPCNKVEGEKKSHSLGDLQMATED